jgi:dolichol-phosphate mannosyltransferase
MTYYFLIPVFNESQNLETLANRIIPLCPDQHKYFVFVDDGSTDQTTSLIRSLFAGHAVQVIEKTENIGPGDSFNRGFEWILDHSTCDNDLVITMEGDNTSDISILPHMVKISEIGYDLVLASVYAQGGKFEKTSLLRKIISFFANMLFRAFFNIKVLTLSSFYRVYSITLLQKIKKEFGILIREKGFICMLEILIKAIHVNAKVIEVPMLLKSDQRKGKTKMRIMINTLSYLRFLLSYKK